MSPCARRCSKNRMNELVEKILAYFLLPPQLVSRGKGAINVLVCFEG